MFEQVVRASSSLITASSLLVCSLGCSSEIGSSVTSRSGSDGTNAGASGVVPPSNPVNGGASLGNAGEGNLVGSGPLFDNGSGPISGSAVSGASAEICDGVDNDTNGVVDDVDVGGDGVCDCLNIATIGEIGPWGGSGNLFETWLNQRSPMGAASLGNQVLTDDLLRPFQVIFVLYAATSRLDANGRTLQPHHEFSAEEAAVFQRWIEAGGGVMTTAGYLSDEVNEVANVNRLLNAFGVGYSTTRVNLDGFVRTWQQHPITQGIVNIRTANGVEASGAGKVLANDDNMRLALEVAEPSLGHVVVWGDEWITYDSEWRNVQDQQVERLWLNVLSWLTPREECQVPIPPSIR